MICSFSAGHGKGTTGAVFVVRWIQEKHGNKEENLYSFGKSFD